MMSFILVLSYQILKANDGISMLSIEDDHPIIHAGSLYKNYIVSAKLTHPSQLTDGVLDREAIITVKYFDGLGREEQNVIRYGSGDLLSDLVDYTEYNSRGKASRKWLPVINSSQGGNADFCPIGSMGGHPSGDTAPYTSIYYEATQESRELETRAPGQAWQQHAGVRKEYRLNSSSVDSLKCGYYKVTPTGVLKRAGNYPTGELYVTIITDEDGHRVTEFVDKDQHKVLSRQQIGSSFADTYYVYDIYGNLCYVLPPMASASLANLQNTIPDTNEHIQKLCYVYKYDHRNRCIEKKLPGCSPVYYIYDSCDNLVYSQDGNQRSRGKWSFIAYDALGRVAYSGVTSERRTAAQLRDAFQNQSPRVCLDAQQELGYTRVYENVSASDIKVVNYYDNYDFLDKFAFGDSLQYMPMVNFDEKYVNTMHPQLSAKGLQTGSIARTLDAAGTPLVKSIYYDYHGNVIQSHENNLLGGFDHEFLHLTFTGKPLTALHQHSTDSCYNSDIYTYTYDNLERLLTTAVAHDGAAAVTLCSNTYDALGRLASSTVNNGGNRTAYSYNVRGWTQSVTNNHFYEWLHYQDAPSGGTPCYNGNISGITWLQRESMKAATSVESKYSFSYDGLNRLTQAAYCHVSDLEEDEDDWNGDLITYNDRNFSCSYAYDLNGNMTNLQRFGVNFYNTSMSTHFRNYGLIDNLTMNYSGNQLTSVTDQCSALTYAGAMEFCDRTNRNDEYTYDANGNMTRDRNKGIHSITYNMLNLPQTILFNDGHETRYTYAADGRKLRVQYLLNNFAIFDGEEAEDGGEDGAEMMPFSLASTNDFVVGGGIHNDLEEAVTTLMVRDYCGNKEYRNGVLDRIHNDYGYWHDGGYFFYVKDYRGDVRVVLDQNNLPVELNSYYPYGSLMAATTAEGVQSRKYGAKELDRENGLNWYDSQARMYDPMIDRTTSLDPKAEKYYSISPYAWCAGNPVKYIDKDGKDYEVAVYDDKILISANFYTTKNDLQSALLGCSIINANSGSFSAQIKDGDNIIELPIVFDVQTIEADITELNCLAQNDEKGNLFTILPDEKFSSDKNGSTISGELVKVKESRSQTSTVGHEFGHALGSTHHGGLMTRSSSERTSETFDKSTVNQIVKNAIKGKTASEGGMKAGKGVYINNSNYSDDLLKKIKININKK